MLFFSCVFSIHSVKRISLVRGKPDRVFHKGRKLEMRVTSGAGKGRIVEKKPQDL